MHFTNLKFILVSLDLVDHLQKNLRKKVSDCCKIFLPKIV